MTFLTSYPRRTVGCGERRDSPGKAAFFDSMRDVRIEEFPKPSAGLGGVVLQVFRCAVGETQERILAQEGKEGGAARQLRSRNCRACVGECPGVPLSPPVNQGINVAAVIGGVRCLYYQRKQDKL